MSTILDSKVNDIKYCPEGRIQPCDISNSN